MARPEDRYVSLRTKRTRDGKTVYRSARTKKIDADPIRDISVPASDVGRLDVMAENVYGSAQEWWRIASANSQVDGSLYRKPGQQVIIPRG